MIEDYAEYLAQEAQSSMAALHQYRILYDASGTVYHFFFEGLEDPRFYMPEVRRVFGDVVCNVYTCGGKKSVIEVREIIKENGYDIKFCLFFVDRDYDEYLGNQVGIDEYTFMTEEYSIENYVCSLRSLEIILQDLVGISKADPIYKAIVRDYSESYDEFIKIILPLSAWIIAARESLMQPNLANVASLRGIISLGSRAFPKSIDFSSFKRRVLPDRNPDFRTCLRWSRRLRTEKNQRWVRGKFVMWFFKEALGIILSEACERRRAQGGKKIAIPASISYGQLTDTLGGRIPAPPALKMFLEGRRPTR